LKNFTDRKGTNWRICLIPMGGYVKLLGDCTKEEADKLSDEEKKYSLYHKHPLQKILIAFGGPLANFVMAFLLLIFMYSISGKMIASSEISEVIKDSPAYVAGIKPGDIVLEVSGHNIENFNDIKNSLFTNLGEEIIFKIQRDFKEIDVKIIPQMLTVKNILGVERKLPEIGIKSEKLFMKTYNFTESVILSISTISTMIKQTLVVLWQMINRLRGVENLSGPIGIAKASLYFIKSGFMSIIWFVVMISVNIGFFNLLPIPILDGGRIFNSLIELAFGNNFADKFAKYSSKLGMALLFMLFIFASYNDIKIILG